MPQPEDDDIFSPWNFAENPPGQRGSGRRPEDPKLTRRQFLERLALSGGILYISGLLSWNVYGFDQSLSKLFESEKPFELNPEEKEQLFSSMTEFITQKFDLQNQTLLQNYLRNINAKSIAFQTGKFGPLYISNLQLEGSRPASPVNKPDMSFIQLVGEDNRFFRSLQFNVNQKRQFTQAGQNIQLNPQEIPSIFDYILRPQFRPTAHGSTWADRPPVPVAQQQGPTTQTTEYPPGTKFSTFITPNNTTISMGLTPQGEGMLSESNR